MHHPSVQVFSYQLSENQLVGAEEIISDINSTTEHFGKVMGTNFV